jgi:uncharacterized membrane protein YdbT with pleckstrin-like domain
MAALGAMLGASVIGAVTSPDDGADFLDTVVGLVAIFFALRLGFKALLWWVDRIVVTDQRIFEVSGVLTRRVASMPLEKVTDMTYRRTVWGRLIGFGDLIVETAGQRQAMDNIAYLPHPDDFYRTVTSLVTTHIPPSPDDLEEPPPGPDEDDTGPLPRVIL